MVLFLISIWQAIASDEVLEIANKEMMRSYQFLQQQEEPAYWIGMGINETKTINIQATNGAASEPEQEHYRYLDIDLRVGDYQLDNTHKILDGSYFDEPTHFDYEFPITNNRKTITQAIWLGIDDAYRSSVRRLIKIKTNSNIKVEREDQSDDFSSAEPVMYLEDYTPLAIDIKQWTSDIRDSSAEFLQYENVIDSMVSLSSEQQIRRILTTDGTQIREVRTHYRISAVAITIAEDGMELVAYEYQDFADMKNRPSKEEIIQLANDAAQKVEALRAAPLIDPYVGPAILRGRASAVFFHEILGHRVEGHRQKDEDECNLQLSFI